jgi:diguanylate cyclase (GGDEF)-like protein/hemerythrin-like metal-binding protein/PAS domain S-box-containing protein
MIRATLPKHDARNKKNVDRKWASNAAVHNGTTGEDTSGRPVAAPGQICRQRCRLSQSWQIMDFFYWNKSFEVGMPAIDSQHRRLVDLINELAAAITEGGKLPDVQSLFGRLMKYAAVHFSDEEKLMAACLLPETEKAEHRKAHRGFVKKAREIMQHPDLLQAEVAEEVLEFLTTWLISHILGSDKRIVQALERGGQALAAGKSLLDISPVERVLLGALNETERRFRLISDQSPVLMWVADANGVRSFFNRTWTDFVGIDAESTGDTDWRDFIHPEDRPAYLEKIRQLPATPQPIEAEYRLRRRDGHYHWFLERILPRLDSGDVFVGLIASATDISAIKEAEVLLSSANKELEQEVARRTAQLEQLMLTDPLTGVGNRRLLTKRLAEETTRARRYQRPLCAVFFDLDHFKRINDVFGHAAGDVVLAGVAESLKACLRDCDLLGRFGGEEFVVLLPETGIDDAMQVAERMRSAVADMQMPQIPVTITVSAGVAEWTTDETGEGLLQRADRALYQAKEAGRNCCRS